MKSGIHVLIIYIHEKKIGTAVRSYLFYFKSAKSSVLVPMVKVGCSQISTSLDLMNNKALNTWLRSIYIHTLSTKKRHQQSLTSEFWLMYFVSLNPKEGFLIDFFSITKKTNKHFKHSIIYLCILFARLIDTLPIH